MAEALRPLVYVTRRLPEAPLERLRAEAEVRVWDDDEPIPRADLLREVRRAQGLLTMLTDRVDAEVLEAAPELRVVSNMAVGFDNLDVAELTRRGIPAGNTPGVLTETSADLAFALLLAAARRLVEADGFVRAGKWTSWQPMLLTGQDVHGATLGIIGLGRIGLEVAKRARGFNMRLLYNAPHRKWETEATLGARYADMYDLLAESDFVTLHVPLNATTRGLIGEKELRTMKPSAVLVNTSRGAVVDQPALYRALKEGVIWAAGLDVFAEEPLPADDPLLTLDNVVVAPHIASASIATRTRMARVAAENLLAVLRGEPAPHTINPEVYALPGWRPGIS